MTLDEAIEKYKSVEDEYTFVHDIDGCLEVVQLVEWLRMARGAEKAGRYFTRDIRELKQRLEDSERENAKLRVELSIREKSEQEKVIECLRQESIDWEDKYRALITENAKLREELEAVGTAAYLYGRDDLKAENAKLRGLVSDMLPFAEVGMDDTCVTRRCCLYEQCEDTVGGPCIIEGHMLGRMRELGIDVPNG